MRRGSLAMARTRGASSARRCSISASKRQAPFEVTASADTSVISRTPACSLRDGPKRACTMPEKRSKSPQNAVLLQLREESAGDGARSALAGPQAEANRMHSDKAAGLSRVWRVAAAGCIRPRNSPGAQVGFRVLPRSKIQGSPELPSLAHRPRQLCANAARG